MSVFGALLFDRLQGAAFYRELHRQAVALLPPGDGRRWIDVGCGPGLLACLAAERGYVASGYDLDPAMIARARRRHLAPRFDVAGLDELAAQGRQADVVSAASLLSVLDDWPRALALLRACLAERGTLLLIEPTARLNAAAASAMLAHRALGARSWMLRLWARARGGGRFVDANALRSPGYELDGVPLLDGLVMAWTLRAVNPAAVR